ncbi:DUF427 domain-containing protein [Nonomuraea sp. SMC257]|uniref:DUF427 domain-containing protein n=1 Tax=Nonomuraea montanisoli TaxID=2741721 RepID=A0A7Y6IDM8_9ACTN|nr:DUF427 domain-containing protein [Nonomuraea montanisoli]NUW36344.1 DUF427 domain-containing protein [Nonomuraea montanisoli]
MPRDVKIPGPDHPITVEATSSHVVVRVGDRVVADTTRPLVLTEAAYPPVHYIPIKDVDPGMIRRSDTRTYCPYKGEASYYSVVTPEGEVGDAIWAYEEPYDAVGEIKGHVAFYPDRVRLTVEPS